MKRGTLLSAVFLMIGCFATGCADQTLLSPDTGGTSFVVASKPSASGKGPCTIQTTQTKSGHLDVHFTLDPVVLAQGTDVHGAGFYSIGNSESTGGRLLIASGSWSSVNTDPNRQLTVRFLSGALKGRTWVIQLIHIDNISIAGKWYDAADPEELNGLTGTTSCLQG